jgi:hypothetical protein
MPSHLVKRLLHGGLLAAIVTLGVPAIAAADAPDITSASGSVSSDGHTVTITGSWAWTTHHSDCNKDRAGVGIAIDWNDPAQAGNPVTTLNGVMIDVGTPSDNNVHNTSGGTGSGFTCGTFNGSYNTGSFSGMTHTYSGALPGTICALAYDVHGKPGIPNGPKEITAGGQGHNSDNSAEKNGQTPAGNVCAQVHITPGCTSNCSPPPPPPPGPPAIALAKAGPASATAGNDVPFNLTVTNPGAQPLTNVTIADPRCDAVAPTLQTKNGDTSPNTLDPGDKWIYVCSSHTAATDTTLHNDSTVTGTPPSGPNVTATASADVPLLGQGVLPLLPGVARLRGPTGCVSRASHVLTVRGSRIARVSFYVDGRYVGTRTRPNRGTAYTVTVRGGRLSRGSHRVTARVTYVAGTNPKTKTLRLSFARCARAVTPKFTG